MRNLPGAERDLRRRPFSHHLHHHLSPSSSPSTSSRASSTASAHPSAGSRAGGSQFRTPSPPHRGDRSSSPPAGSHAGGSQSRSPSPSRDGSRDSYVGSTASTSSQQPKTSQDKTKKKSAKKTDCSLVVEQEQMMLEFLQKNPVLWNCKMTDYRRSDKKGKLLEDQAALMGKTCKYKICPNLLLSNYVEFLDPL